MCIRDSAGTIPRRLLEPIQIQGSLPQQELIAEGNRFDCADYFVLRAFAMSARGTPNAARDTLSSAASDPLKWNVR